MEVEEREELKENKDSDIRSTPQWFFNYWNNIFKFELDTCANSDNAKCDKYFTIKDNGLLKEWSKVNWCNPPYSRGQIDRWLKKCIKEQSKGNTTMVSR